MCVCGVIGYARYHAGTAAGDGLGDRPRSLDLVTHGSAPGRCRRRRARRRNWPRPVRPGKRSATAVSSEPSETRPVIPASAPRRQTLGRGRRMCSRARSVAGTLTTWPGGSRSRSGPSPSAAGECDELINTRPSSTRPLNTSTWCSSVESMTTTASGRRTGSRARMALVEMRQYEVTGAPIRSEPKLGNACASKPSRKAATDSSSAAVTTPWPPRPCKRAAKSATSREAVIHPPPCPRIW